jgi:lysophospholipase L1-like esterase
MTLRAVISRAFAFCLGIGGALLLLEGVLRLLPVIEGTYAAEPRASWRVHTMIPNSRYTYSTGWNLQNVHRGRINNFGYAAPFDYQSGSGGIAIFGDSYIESLMNDYPDTLQGSLNDYLKSPQTVLNFGTSGAEMPDYLGIAPLVSERFSPQWVVIVITVGDFTRGFNASPGFFEWQADRSPPIRLVPEIRRSARAKFLRTVALIRYARGNLSIRPEDLIQLRRGAESVAASGACRPEALSAADEGLLAAYARALPAALRLPPGRIILVFDSDRRGLAAGKALPKSPRCPQRDTLANERLRQIAAGAGMQVIDSFPVFQRHVAAGLGPVDRSPLDAHWNAAAHRLMAQEVARVIDP